MDLNKSMTRVLLLCSKSETDSGSFTGQSKKVQFGTLANRSRALSSDSKRVCCHFPVPGTFQDRALHAVRSLCILLCHCLCSVTEFQISVNDVGFPVFF